MEDTTALESGQTAAVETAPVVAMVTIESLTEMATSNDHAQVSRAIELMEKIDSGTSIDDLNIEIGAVAAPVVPDPVVVPDPADAAAVPSPAPVVAPAPVDATDQAAAPAATAAPAPNTEPKKFYDFSFRGAPTQMTDSDGFLGYGSMEGMKKALAHRTLFLNDMQDDRNNAHSRASEEARKRAEIEKEASDLRSKIAAFSGVAPGTPPPIVAPAAEAQFDVPVAPTPPDIPADPSDWSDEDASADKAWRTATSEYNTKMAAVVARLITRPPTTAGISPEIAQQIADIKAQLAATTEVISQTAAERAALASEKKAVAYWSGIKKFSDRHADYSMPDAPDAVDKSVKAWMDQLAYANGVTLPYAPTQEDVKKYENDKLNLVGSYLENDPQVVERGSAFTPPDGYKAYFALGDLHRTHAEYIQAGVLGQNSTIEDAWLRKQHLDGGFDTSVASLEVTAQARGVDNALQSLAEHQAGDAVTIPNDSAAGQGHADAGWTQAEIIEALSATADVLAANPQLRAKRAKIMASLPEHQRTTVST